VLGASHREAVSLRKDETADAGRRVDAKVPGLDRPPIEADQEMPRLRRLRGARIKARRIDSRVIRYACASPHTFTARLKKLSRSRRVSGEKPRQIAVSR